MTGPGRILVTGGTGQVGRALQHLSWPAAVSLHSPGRDELDLSNPASLLKAIHEAGYVAVINAAAFTGVDKAETHISEAFQTNATAAAALAEACRNAQIPMVQVSTDYVFNGQADAPWREEDTTDPLGVYGASKLAGELAVTAAGGRAVILRTAWIVSPWGQNFAKTMLRIAADRESVGVVSDQTGSPTSALDLAEALQAIVSKMLDSVDAPTGIYHFVNAGQASWAQLAEHVFDVSRKLDGPYASVKHISTADYPTPVRRPAYSVLSTRKIQADFNITPKDWRLSVEEVIRSTLSAKGL